MIVDCSALVAVLQREPEEEALSSLLHATPLLRLSAANHLEASMVIGARRGRSSLALLDDLIDSAGIVVEPVTRAQALLAREAFMRFGKGRHQAGLNFGDCFAYALAKSFDEPLLCKGDDFARTDLALVAY